MIKKKLLALSFAWAAVTVFFLLLLLLLDISRHRESLQLESSVIYEYAYERALVNEVLLHNFVLLVANDPGDFPAIQRYAREMLDHYPHILRFEMYQRVASQQVPGFERHMQDVTQRSFHIRTYDESNFETPARLQQPFYYPLILVEPMDATGGQQMGGDSYSRLENRVAINQAGYYLDVFASVPYRLPQGRIGYRLFHALNVPVEGQEDAQYLVSLVIPVEELLPPLPHIQNGLNVTLFDPAGKELASRGGQKGLASISGVLPVIIERRSIHRFGQSWDILVQKQLSWGEVNWPIVLIVLVFSLVAYLFTLQNYIRQQRAEGKQQQLNEKLRTERDLLEERVQERTWELVQTNSELRKHVKENRSLTQKILSIQEEERRNLARELHDEMGQALTAIRTDSHLLKQHLADAPKSIYYQAALSIDNIAQRIYGVTYGMMRALRPSALDDLGLSDALRECIANTHLDNSGVKLHLSLSGALNEMPEELNISCYRLVQEALNNCVKHADAKNLWLTVTRTDAEPDTDGESSNDAESRLLITIADDGAGFSSEDRSRGKGFGLIGMRERVLALEGTFELNSEPGKGTRIEVSLPVRF